MEIGLLSFYFHSLIIAHRHEGNGDWVMLGEHKGPSPCANDPFRLCPHSVLPSSQHSHQIHKYIFYQSPLVIYLKEPFELNFQIIFALFHNPTEKPNILSRKKYIFFVITQSSPAVSSSFNLDSPWEVLRGHAKIDGKDKWMATVILKADFSLWSS